MIITMVSLREPGDAVLRLPACWSASLGGESYETAAGDKPR